MTNTVVIWLEEVGKEDIAIVGGKGASIGEMLRGDLLVPGGFAVTAQAFRRFIDENGINDELFGSFEVDVDNADILRNPKKKARTKPFSLPWSIKNTIDLVFNIAAGILVTIIFEWPDYRNEASLLLIILALCRLLFENIYVEIILYRK